MIYVIDCNEDCRRRTCSIIESEGMQATPLKSGEELLELDLSAVANCILADLRMPGLNGIMILDEVARRKYAPPVVITTAHADFDSAVAALRRGAFDLLEKPLKAMVLIDCLQRAMRAANLTFRAGMRNGQISTQLSLLSEREREVLRLHLQGASSKEIARALDIGSATADNYRSRVMQKLGARSAIDLAEIYCALGLCTSSDVCSTTFPAQQVSVVRTGAWHY
ncbi:response regulator transcription factor [Vogesella fluminis]|uniref:Transcriptional regulatory protein FixJ n=1 Tax=Vogesella fluminis TaxID=1069161 RepID=A0ABQ3HGK4_9NEIS|nr:response regulator [Vogesella fluminis]GHD82215.1 transcriptional regulatory protein FixJ [Vogesella fluminis]